MSLELYDAQRVYLLETLPSAITKAGLDQEPVMRRLLKEWKQQLPAFQQNPNVASPTTLSPEELDPAFNSAVRALNSGLQTELERALSRGKEAEVQTLKRTQKRLFEQGVSAVIHVYFTTQQVQTRVLLERCEETEVAAVLKRYKLENDVKQIQTVYQKMSKALESQQQPKEQRTLLSNNLKEARVAFHKSLRQCLQYIELRLSEDSPTEKASKESILQLVEEAKSTAQDLRQRNRKKSTESS